MIGTLLLTLAGAALACIIGTKVWKTRRKNQLGCSNTEHRYYDIDGNEHPLGELTKHDVPRMLKKRTPETPVNYKVHEYYKSTKYERKKNNNKHR